MPEACRLGPNPWGRSPTVRRCWPENRSASRHTAAHWGHDAGDSEMTPGPRANSHQVAIGLCILMLGVCLVLDRVGLIPASETLKYWPIGLIIIGLSVILQAFRDTSQVRHSVPWGAIFLLLIVGFVGTRVFERRAGAADTSESASIFAVLGGDRRAGGPGFRSASITAVMGGAQLDLRNVQPR